MDVSKLRFAQIERLINLGFNKALGLSPDDYRKRFPQSTPRPIEYDGRFEVFRTVDPTVHLKLQHQAVGVKEFIDSEKLTTNGQAPKAPYFIWTHDGKRYKTKSMARAMEAFANDEIACSQLEVTSLFIHYPHLFKACGIDSGRTHNGNGYYSTLIWVQEYPELALHHLNDFTPGLSVLSRGKLEEES
jgi:hypothetical protein